MNKDEKIVEQRNLGLMLENLARIRKLMFHIFKKQVTIFYSTFYCIFSSFTIFNGRIFNI